MGRVYAITKCTQGRELLFWPCEAGTLAAGQAMEALKQVQACGYWTVLACVVMPDHLHAVVKLKEGDLSHAVKLFSMHSTRRINETLQRSGSIWQGGYYDHALRGEKSLHAYLEYLNQNPVRAGLVNEPDQWPFRLAACQRWSVPKEGESPPKGGSHKQRGFPQIEAARTSPSR